MGLRLNNLILQLAALKALGCPSYTKVIILQLLQFKYWEDSDQAFWEWFSTYPADFNEDDGEISLSILARSLLCNTHGSTNEHVSHQYQHLSAVSGWIRSSKEQNQREKTESEPKSQNKFSPTDKMLFGAATKFFDKMEELFVNQTWKHYPPLGSSPYYNPKIQTQLTDPPAILRRPTIILAVLEEVDYVKKLVTPKPGVYEADSDSEQEDESESADFPVAYDD